MDILGKPCETTTKTPFLPYEGYEESIVKAQHGTQEQKDMLFQWAFRMKNEHGFLTPNDNTEYSTIKVENIFFSVCFDCKKIAIWVHDNLVFPPQRHGPPPNPDLPDDIKKEA